MKGAGAEAPGVGTDPTPWGDPLHRAAQTYEPGPAGTNPEGKHRKKKKKQRIHPLSAYRSPLARPPVPQSEGISSPLLFQAAPALKRGEIRASARSLSPPDHGGSVSTRNTVSRAFGSSPPYFLFSKPPEQHAGGAEGGNTLRDSYPTLPTGGDTTKSSLAWTRQHRQRAR